jgi:chemotaxis protein methyltransferase CheR
VPAVAPDQGLDEAAPPDGYPLGRREFHWFRDLIYREAGIHLRDSKLSLVASRLTRRLRLLGLDSFAAYIHHLGSADRDGHERRELINCITTNKTDFFREEHHFDFLRDTLFPAIRERARQGGPRRLRIWSAGCSTGEEPYSLAMTIAEHFGPRTGWEVGIVASDIDTAVLAKAHKGIYTEERLEPVSEPLRKRHFQRGTGGRAGHWRVRPELKALVELQQVNLNQSPWPVSGPFDAIFCRNVIIYFDKPTQQLLFERFARELDPHGCLFIGHSESLIGISDRFSLIGRTIHRLAGPRRAAEPAAGTGGGERRIVVGEVFASREPTWVRTLLGSCVSACLYDPHAAVGGMNHFLLPTGGEDGGARFGVHAMELLINEIMKLGGHRPRLVAKVFGAAHVISRIPSRVPQQNAEFVRAFLHREGIRIVGERMGGTAAQEVWFETASGRARVRYVAASAPALESEEESARSQLDRQRDAADVSQAVIF